MKGASLRDFRPNYQKIYYQSIKEYLNPNIQSTNFGEMNNKQASETEHKTLYFLIIQLIFYFFFMIFILLKT